MAAGANRYSFIHLLPVKRLGLAVGLERHVRGRARPESAREMRPDEGPPVVEIAAEREKAALMLAAERLARKRIGGVRPYEAQAVLCSGPPAYHEWDAWSREKESEWAERSLAFVRRLFGSESAILTATLHRDETSPHIHMLVVPANEAGEFGWTKRKREAHGVLGLTKRAARVRGAEYSALQTAYHEAAGREFGLLRGRSVRETGATRQGIDRQKAAEAACARAEAEAKRMIEEAVAEAELVATEAEGVREDALAEAGKAREGAEAARAEGERERKAERAAGRRERAAEREAGRREGEADRAAAGGFRGRRGRELRERVAAAEAEAARERGRADGAEAERDAVRRERDDEVERARAARKARDKAREERDEAREERDTALREKAEADDKGHTRGVLEALDCVRDAYGEPGVDAVLARRKARLARERPGGQER